MLQVANEFKDELRFYFPHNLDFRGRAYPLHPHLNHMGPDVCRGLLTFAEARPLGPDGIGWLYVLVRPPAWHHHHHYYYTLFLPRGKVRPADKLQSKAAIILLHTSKIQPTVGMVLIGPSWRGATQILSMALSARDISGYSDEKEKSVLATGLEDRQHFYGFQPEANVVINGCLGMRAGSPQKCQK